jgi:BirA family biotin operon repressor/biotin-[acetyl-CoA-carboxylase] ligase
MTLLRHQPDIPGLTEFDEIGSTNDVAREKLRQGVAEGAVVWAHRQTAGRGRQGNHWTSDAGNLFATFILRPQVSAADCGQLSFLSAVALAETAEIFLPPSADVRLKWPNDMLINGQKAAGILLESEGQNGKIDGVVIGIGVNLARAPQGAISLNAAGAGLVDTGLFLERLYHNLMTHYAVWKKSGFEDIRVKWLSRAWKKGEVINIRLPQENFSAVFKDIGVDGSLEALLSDGTLRRIHSGEVYL